MSKFLLFACLLVGIVATANVFAQIEEAPGPPSTEDPAIQEDDAPPERGEGVRGRGRFGEQLLGYVPLLQVDSVRNELKLEGDQATQVETLTVKIREDFADDIRELMQSFRDADPADRQQFREKMADIAAKVNEQLSTVLNNEQTSRLRQINLQLGLRRNGAAEALSSADIAAALDLTAEQQEQLREQARAGRRERGREAKTLEEARQEANELLTPEQQEKLTNLLGAEFDLPAAMLEGGRGRGGLVVAVEAVKGGVDCGKGLKWLRKLLLPRRSEISVELCRALTCPARLGLPRRRGLGIIEGCSPGVAWCGSAFSCLSHPTEAEHGLGQYSPETRSGG